ncbi:MAG: glycoside hydrolase family 65 protein [Candidatus Binatia bacterium]
MNPWSLVYDTFDPAQETLREALCTLGNGYFATRGAAPEAVADAVHYPGTYVAGCYNRLRSEIAGRVVENEDLVNVPNWLPLTFRVAGGEWFNLQAVQILSYLQKLDFKQGILLRTVRFRDARGRETTLSSRRLVHMSRPHFAALETTLTAENWSGRVDVRSALDGRVRNTGVKRYRDLNSHHLRPLEARAIATDALYLKVYTCQSEIRLAEAARTRVFQGGVPVAVQRQTIERPGYVAHKWAVELCQGRAVTVEKIGVLYTSQDHAISECGLEARQAATNAPRFDELLQSHTQAWANLWKRLDVGIEADQPDGERVAGIVRLHVFHLLQTASPNSMDLDAGVPARGWHGEAYRGHVFWDELFVLPSLNLRISEITRALLQYRFRRLGAARSAARAAGFRGAMYPWQSGSDGREESQTFHLNPNSGRWIPDNTRLQRHVNAAIAYNVWHYYQVTGDMEFLSFYGAEMILEIARFWASVATYNGPRDRYEILGVMGPDEYHDRYPGAQQPGLNNNACTNVMAVWVLCRALELVQDGLLPDDRREELCSELRLDPAEIAHWEDVSRKMRVVFHDDGIVSQFEGYDRLEEFDWEGYRTRYVDIQRLDRILEAEGDTPNRYKASKQADVLMLFYLFSAEELSALFERLGYPFASDTIPKNIDYYVRRTSHGSTLSGVVHSWVLARSDRARSWELFIQALQSDVADIQGGTTAEGIHLGAMAGTIDVVQRCYTGIETRGDTLWFNPCLPQEHLRLRLRIRYRGHSLDVEVTQDKLKVRALRGTARRITIGVRDQIHELVAGAVKEFPL